MSIITKDKKGYIPIAKVKDGQTIIYFNRESQSMPEIPKKNVKQLYNCKFCGETLKCKYSFIQHLKFSCPKKKDLKKKYHTDKQIMMIPQFPDKEAVNIFVSGLAGSGKSYWMNQYAKNYKKIYKERIVLFTRHNDIDPTLEKDINMYEIIRTGDIDINNDKYPLEYFTNCLVIFDDIEDSEKPKVTKYLWKLINDMFKNGRHRHISTIVLNQELLLGAKTKVILRCATGITLFPKYNSIHELTAALKKYYGLIQTEIDYILSLNTRGCYIHKLRPNYVIADHDVYIIGSENI